MNLKYMNIIFWWDHLKQKEIKMKYNFGAAASKMEFFVTIAKDWNLRPIDTRNFILHAAGFYITSGNRQNSFMRFTYGAHSAA